MNIFVWICMCAYIYIYKLSQSIAFNLSNVFHYLKTKKQQQKKNKRRPAPKLLPYGVADIKFLCQWYEKTSFLRNSLHWHKKHMSVQENQRKSLQWHKKNMSAPGKNECWRKNVMSGPEKMKEKNIKLKPLT